MTVLDATEQLFEWYRKNDSFEEKEVSKIVLLSDTPDRDRAAFLCALSDMEKAEIVSRTEIEGNRTIWTLKRRLDSFNQTVDIPKTIAVEIATVLNSACRTLGDYHDQCDPYDISTKDLCNLAFISKTALASASQAKGASVEDILMSPQEDWEYPDKLPPAPPKVDEDLNDEDEEKN